MPLYAIESNVSQLGTWSIKERIDEYSNDTVRELEYNSTETVSGFPKVCVSLGNYNGHDVLDIILLVTDVTSTNYYTNSKIRGNIRHNFVDVQYRYLNDAKDFTEFKNIYPCVYARLSSDNAVLESIMLEMDTNLMRKKYLSIKFTDPLNDKTRIIKISLDGFLVNYNKLRQWHTCCHKLK